MTKVLDDLVTPLALLPRNRKWTAQWVWPQGGDAGENAVALLRRTVRLDTPARADLLVSAFFQYRLWVNGELLGDGPPPSAGHATYYDTHRLDLPAGTTTIAALIWTAKVEPPYRGAFLAELLDESGTVLDATGPSWRAMPGRAWRQDVYRFGMNFVGPFQEHLDARRLPEGWTEAGFDDTAWQPAEPITGRGDRPPRVEPWSNLQPRDIPPLERDVVRPTEVVAVESVVALTNRTDSDDASAEACQPGTPLTGESDATVDHVEHLLTDAGDCTLSCRPASRQPWVDGRRDPCVTLGFDEEVTAFIEVELTAPAGATLFLASAERLLDGRLNNTIESRFVERYTARAGRQTFRSLHWRAFRYLRMRMGNTDEPVKIHAVRAIRVRSPLGDGVAKFDGDDRLGAIDTICRRTIRLCAVDGLFDTPWREAAQWLGDVAMATVPALHWAYGDTAMAGKFFKQSALNGQSDGILSNLSNTPPMGGAWNIPDYSLWWLYGLREHRWFTGDDAWYRTFYPEACRIIRWYLRYLDDAGLLADTPQWTYIDWANVTRNGRSAPLNAMFAMACDVLVEMAECLGDGDTARWAGVVGSGIRRQFVPTFWDEQRRVVVDAVVDGRQVAKISEHGLATAIVFDCLEGVDVGDLVARCWERDAFEAQWVECQPFFTRIVLEALHGAGRTDLALRVIERRWGERFVDAGWQSCLEEWTTNGTWRGDTWAATQRTLSHAWSAAPAEFFQRRLPGIELDEPGGGRISVNPYAGDFAYAVTVPLPAGAVQVTYTPGKPAEIKADGKVKVG
jgi:hypothetical protein